MQVNPVEGVEEAKRVEGVEMAFGLLKRFKKS